MHVLYSGKGFAVVGLAYYGKRCTVKAGVSSDVFDSAVLNAVDIL